MKSKFREVLESAFVLALLLAVVIAIALTFNYRIDLYKRKYPGTTTLDFWLDSRQ